MKILLVKCHKATIFTHLEPIVTEPLELEYLAAVLNKYNVEYRIYDSIIEGGSFEKVYTEYRPDVLALSGYITAVDTIKAFAAFAKSKNQDIKVLVGGIHAEVNYKEFFGEHIDLIIHSDGINTFDKLVQRSFRADMLADIQGIAYNNKEDFIVNPKIPSVVENMPLPDRSYFERHKSRTRYLNYSPVAIIKTALSCPFSCSFCYCKLLNQGMYTTRCIDNVVEEIESIDNEYIWIVDDSFLIDRKRVISFIEAIEKQNIKKKFIAYSRADFIANNEDIIKKLAETGFVDIIVGMEAVEDDKLHGLNKNCAASDNKKTVEILRKYGIKLTALFITGLDFTVEDFKRLRAWIKKMDLRLYTLSIFTPMRGVEGLEHYEERLTTSDYSKWDFLHLVVKPGRMSTAAYYFQFYLSYLPQLFKNKDLQRFIINRFFVRRRLK
jgi:hopanoid C-3 methylase